MAGYLLILWCLHTAVADGITLDILALFDVHMGGEGQDCSRLNPEAVQHAAVIQYVTSKLRVNNTNTDVFVHIVDTCGESDETLNTLRRVIDRGGGTTGINSSLAGIIINSRKEIAADVITWASLFSVPVVNVAEIVEIDDVSYRESSVVNMAPSRYVLADAVTAFLKQKDVPYIQAMTSDTPYHRRFLQILNERTAARDCCVVTQFTISRNLSKPEINRILDGWLMEGQFSPGTVMVTTEEDFEYLLEEYAPRARMFGPMFIGFGRPRGGWIDRFRRAMTGATFFETVKPSEVNSTEFTEFIRQELTNQRHQQLSQQTPSLVCPNEDPQDCYGALLNATDLNSGYVSSYIQAAVQMLFDSVAALDKTCHPQSWCQKTFRRMVLEAKDCGDSTVCENVSHSPAMFDVYSVTITLKLIQAGNITGIHSFVQWPFSSHLNHYWEVLNRVRLGFRAECRNKVQNKYAMLNKDNADAYVIGVLHNHRDQTSPSGCDEDKVHMEHILRSEAILYAVDQINARTDILPNITLGAIVIDSCYITDKIIQQVVDITNGHVQIKNRFGLLSVPIGMVGTSSSKRTVTVAPTIQSYNIPMVSFSASSPLLSDKHKYPLFFRPIASDVKQALAIVHLLEYYRWTYFGCVYSSTDYGTYGIREVISQARHHGMKVAYQVQLDNSFVYDKSGLDYVFEQFIVNRKDKVKVIVAFLETRHAEEIFKAAERHDLQGLVWIGSDSFTDGDISANSKYALGSIGVVFHTGILSEFGRYIDAINARNYTRNPFYLDLVESKLKCYLNEENKLKFPRPCPVDARLVYSEISSGGEASPTIDCVLSLAHGLDFLVNRHCKSKKLCTDAKREIKTIPSVMTELIFEGASGDRIMFDSKGDGVDRYDFINLQPPRAGSENTVLKSPFATWDAGQLNVTSTPFVTKADGQFVPVTDVSGYCQGPSCSSTSPDIVAMEYAYKRGELMLHAFFPVHYFDTALGTCSSKIDHSSFEAVVAALWSVDMINDENLLPGIKLGIAVYDTCSSPARAKQLSHEVVMSTFVVPRPPDIPQRSKLIGLIGSTHDDETLALEGERRGDNSSSKLPLISMTSSILPNDLASDGTFYRTVPPTDAEIQLIIQLLKKLNWDYVHLVYTASVSKNQTVKRFVADASSKGVCVATKVALHAFWKGPDRYTEAVYHMLNVTGATAVVMMTDDSSTEKLLAAARDVRAHGKLFWVATQSWRSAKWIASLQDIAIGALLIAPNQTINTEFGKNFTSLSIVNGSKIAWFQDYWQSYFQCNLAKGSLYKKTCTADLKLNSSGEYEQSWEVPSSINAVYAFAHAVKSIAKKCDSQEIQCNKTLVEYLNHNVLVKELPGVNFAPPGGVNFFFRERSGQGSFEIFNMQTYRGSYRFIRVGRYNNGGLFLNMHHTGMYRNGRRLIPTSRCPGHCKVCLTDKFLEQYKRRVDALREAGPPLEHHLNRAIGIVMVSLLCLGVGFTALMAFYLFKLMASKDIFTEVSLDSSVTLIIGVLLLYLSNVTFVFSATNATCGVRRICLGMAYCLCFSAQLIDVARLAVISQLHVEISPRDLLEAKRVYVYLPVLVAGQIVPTIFWLFLEPSGALLSVPLPQEVATLNEVLPTWRCKIDRYELVCSLVYDAIILLHALVLSVSNRNVTTASGVRPARYVLVSTAVSTCIWIAWIPLYLHLENNDGYLALVSVGISLDATFMLGINFMPKVIRLMEHSGNNAVREISSAVKRQSDYSRFSNTDRENLVKPAPRPIRAPKRIPRDARKPVFMKHASNVSAIMHVNIDRSGAERRRDKRGDSEIGLR